MNIFREITSLNLYIPWNIKMVELNGSSWTTHRIKQSTTKSHLGLLCHCLSSQKAPWGTRGFVSAEAGSLLNCPAVTTLLVWAQCEREKKECSAWHRRLLGPVVLRLRSYIRDSSPSGEGGSSVFLKRFVNSALGSSLHINIHGKLCLARRALKSEQERITLTWTQLQRTFRSLCCSVRG